MENAEGMNQSAAQADGIFSVSEQSVRIYIEKALENRTRFPQEALEWAKTALHSSRTLGHPQFLAAALNSHAYISAFMNHLISAEQNAEEALSVSKRIHFDQGRADAFRTLGIVLLKRGSNDEALQLFLEALSIYDRLKCLHGKAGILNQLGIVYHHFGKAGKALSYFEEAREIYEDLDDKNSVADELNNIGLLKRNMNEFDSALNYLDEAVGLYRETGNSTANVLLNIAGVHESKGNIDKAFDTYTESLSIAENRQDSYRMAIAAMKIGRLMIERRRYEDAYGYLLQSFRLAHSLGIKELKKEVYEAVSMMYKLGGDYKRAFRYYRAGVALKDEIISTEKNDRIAELYIQHELRKKEEEAKKYKRRSRKFEKLSKVDELTGLFNRRYINYLFRKELERSRRYSLPLSIAVADIDHFKLVNDNYSHLIGDQVLRRMADLFREGVRSSDMVGRYGGEEFLFVFCNTSLRGAVTACETLKSRISRYDWSIFDLDRRITVSFGLSAVGEGCSCSEMIESADKRLYEAKQAGRNRVCR